MFIKAGNPVRMSVTGLVHPIGLTHAGFTWGNYVTASRNVMSMISTGQKVTIQYIGVLSMSGHNSWAGFSLSGSMDPLVAFSVARYTSMTSQGLVSYDLEIINTGQFNMESSTFVVPLDGIYYFSISVGLHPYIPVELVLRVNGDEVYSIFHLSRIHNGMETISGTILLHLQTGDKVSLYLIQGEIYSSAPNLELSLVCFLYSPKSTSSVAWLVSKINSTSVKGRSPVIYDRVYIIKGASFHNLSTVRVPVSGIYYIYHSVAVPRGETVNDFSVVRNNVRIAGFSLVSLVSAMSGMTTVSQSIIHPLKAGDKLTPANLGHYSVDTSGNVWRATAFMGFIIKETS